MTEPEQSSPRIQAQIKELRRHVRRVKIAFCVFLCVIVDVLFVSAATGFDRGTMLWNSVSLGYRTPGRIGTMWASIYETPEGVRIVSDGGPDYDALAAAHSPFPPETWEHVAYVVASEPSGGGRAGGFFTPWSRPKHYIINVVSLHEGSDPDEAKWRDLYLEWVPGHDPAIAHIWGPHAQKLRKGSHVETNIVWPLLINELVVIGVSIWCGSVLVRKPLRSMRLLRRWDSRGCPECRYDLGEMRALGCPECGWGRGEDG